jgi:hypothetical protein
MRVSFLCFKTSLLSLVLLSLSVSAVAMKRMPEQPNLAPELERVNTPQGTVYVFKVSQSSPYRLKLGISPKLATVDSDYWQNAEKSKPLFVINAGFFDPLNQQTSSYMSQNGKQVGDPMQNKRLVDNPKLKPYLPKILNRSEFRVYQCVPGGHRYDIVPHQAPAPIACQIESAVGAGPLLLPERTDKEEAFIDSNAQGQRTRDPIGVDAHNARSAIGLNASGDAIFIMAAQHEDGSGGVSLTQLSTLLKEQGATKALALDGGSSSSLRYGNESIFGKVNSKGQVVRRPVKSVWLVVPKL